MNLVPRLWEDLKILGFQGSITTFDDLYKWMRKMNLSYMPPTIQCIGTLYSANGCIYKDIQHFMSGNYGDIHRAIQQKGENETTVYIKRTPQYPRTLILEGFLQQIARAVLEYYGFHQSVPQILDILQHPKDGVICVIESIPNSFLFSEYFEFYIQNDIPTNTIEHTILEIIAQVATYMAILESALHFNHRDLKGNNILMISPTQVWAKSVSIQDKHWKLSSTCKVIIVDFGMACIGNSKGEVRISADQSMMMSDIDFCPKEGRDMFLLLVDLWNNPSIRSVFSPKTCDLFHKWLRDNTRDSWAKDIVSIPLQLLGENYKATCRRLNKKTFRSESCNPIRILQDLSKAYPDIVSFSA
jgi:serine/threonine protein kinase